MSRGGHSTVPRYHDHVCKGVPYTVTLSVSPWPCMLSVAAPMHRNDQRHCHRVIEIPRCVCSFVNQQVTFGGTQSVHSRPIKDQAYTHRSIIKCASLAIGRHHANHDSLMPLSYQILPTESPSACAGTRTDAQTRQDGTTMCGGEVVITTARRGRDKVNATRMV